MKILMISNHLGVQSGVQRYVQNLLLNLDLTRYQVDLFVGLCPPDQASCAPALEAAGVHIIAVPDNKKARIRALYQHLKTHKDYDIIHYHTASKIGAPVCGMMRVLCPHAKIIVHSHIVYPPMTLTWRAAHLVYQLFADYFLGCGVAAGRFVFGDHIDRRPNFSVACNAVDQTRFYPNAAARTAIRAQYGITGTERLAGFVGRLNHQKNPLYLIRVFAAMVQQDPRWKLLLVGGGEQEQPMRELAAQLGVADRVLFAGVQNNVPDYMNAFDLFLLPSNFEGSPVTLVEAQGCGVPCLASTNVPGDGSVTELVHFLPLSAPFEEWAKTADSIAPGGPHADYWPTLAAAGYEANENYSETRKLVVENPEAGVRYFLVKPSDVAIYVEHGAADIGIVGKDILTESGADVYELLDTGMGKCRMCVAGPRNFVDDESRALRVATKFVNIARAHYESIGRDIDIIKLNGSIELAPILGLSDVIVDIVETGTTLKENNLAVLEEFMPISARFIANKASYKFKYAQLTELLNKMKEALAK